MKKIVQILILFFILITINAYAQNNAPLAVNDTFYIKYNDSITIYQFSGTLSVSTPSNLNFITNDSDPNGNLFYVDTAFYNGGGFFSIVTNNVNPNFKRSNIVYKPPLNFFGTDSVQYIIKDDGVPIMYDTAIIYFYVKRKEYEYLNLNNINARVGHDFLFTEQPSSSSNIPYRFEVPKGSGKHTVAGAFLWMGGKNQDSIYTNANTYATFAAKTYGNSGPIMNPVHYKKDYDFDWDRVWKINNYDIQYHIANWQNTSYQPIEVIADWPAHGDTTKGQAFYLAPFIDNNEDGVYNPYDGDYPQIKGQQAIYFIYNNERDRDSSTSNESMKTEVHGMAYAYNCPADSAINNTVFLDYTIYNRSALTFDSTIIGFMTNINIGNGWDDYMGSDVDRSSFYGYNGDLFDESDSANAIVGYGANPPMQAVTFLKGAKQDDDGIDNAFGINANETINGLGFGDGIPDNEYWGLERFKTYQYSISFCCENGNPTSKYDFYNYLNGQWDDGSKIVWGGNGNGASTGGTIPAKYLYPGVSDLLWYGTGGIVTTPINWSEFNEGNPPGDRNGLGTTGPFTFKPDSSISITIALTFAQDYQNTGQLVALPIMQERIDSIRSYYLTDFISACGGTIDVNEQTATNSSLLVYPNPFNNELTINYKVQNKLATLEIYDLLGEKVKTNIISNNTTLLNLSNLVAGIYFIKVIDGNNFVTQKVIKQ